MLVCPNCGAQVAHSARFCSRCGARQEGAGGTVAPLHDDNWDLCEIGWWRGYVKAEFYAAAVAADGSAYEAGRSRQFRWRKHEPPAREHDQARAAHEDLVRGLRQGGWEPLGDAVPWYALRFRRHATGLRVLAGELEELKAGEEDSAEG